MKNRKPIVVSGAHRSGSTWVGQVLSFPKGMGYLHEPFNPIYANPVGVPINKWFLKVDSSNELVYKKHFKEVLTWKFRPFSRLANVNSILKFKLWLKYWKVFSSNKVAGNRMLMKDPISLFSLPWLHETFGVGVLVLVRHPAAFVYSLKRKGWEFPFEDLLSQENLMSNELKPYRAQIEEFANHKQDIIAQGALIWRLLYSAVVQYEKQYPNWVIKTHEEISMQALSEFEEIFGLFNVPFDGKVKEFVKKTSGNENPKGTIASEELLRRDSRANTQYWKRRLTKDEVAYLKKETADIWPHFYTEEDW